MKSNLSNVIKKGKDTTNTLQKTNVIYRIPCKKCKSSYVGETKRMLAKRIGEHERDVRKNANKVVPLHCKNGHVMDWDKVKTLDSESNYYKRHVSEMIHIHLQEKALNLKQDTNSLHSEYIPILDNLNKIQKKGKYA